jgi:hypothetical protein
MLDHRIETQTKKLRSSTPGTTQYDSGVKYLLDSFEFIREYDDEMKRTARASEEEDVEGPTCDEPCSPTQPPRGVGSFVSVSSNRDTRRIYDEFLASVEGDVDAMLRISGGSDASSAHPSLPTELSRTRRVSNPKKYDETEDICACGGRRVIDFVSAMAICTECAVCVPYLEKSSKALTHTETLERGNRKQFQYKRITHFCETLSSIQGRQRVTVPDDVLSVINGELKKYRIHLKDVTSAHIRQFLKRLGLTKYYDASHLIINILRGENEPVIPRHIEQQLIRMFVTIQKPFDNVCENGRKNMLRYNYVVYKLLQLLGRDGEPYLYLFPLLKSKAKLSQHDETWKRICREIGWEFIATM